MRNIIYELCGWEQFQDMEADYDTVKAAIEPALDYLRELNPYLWNEGKTFPESSTTVDAMFADGELVMNMSYGPFSVATGIAEGTYTDTTRTFVFDNRHHRQHQLYGHRLQLSQQGRSDGGHQRHPLRRAAADPVRTAARAAGGQRGQAQRRGTGCLRCGRSR